MHGPTPSERLRRSLWNAIAEDDWAQADLDAAVSRVRARGPRARQPLAEICRSLRVHVQQVGLGLPADRYETIARHVTALAETALSRRVSRTPLDAHGRRAGRRTWRTDARSRLRAHAAPARRGARRRSARRARSRRRGTVPRKLGALRHLALAESPLTLTQLAERHCCGRSNVTALIDRLEADGLVERTVDPSDRRNVRASLTAGGSRGVSSAPAPCSPSTSARSTSGSAGAARRARARTADDARGLSASRATATRCGSSPNSPSMNGFAMHS